MKRPVNRESNTPQGAYQVWHREGDSFQQVGAVKVANLLVAAEATMNGNPSDWMDRGEDGKLPSDSRQTKTGDVLISPDGDAFRLKGTEYGFTFEAVDFAQVQRVAALFGEQRAEFQMGQEEAARGAFMQDIDTLREIVKEPEQERGGMEM